MHDYLVTNNEGAETEHSTPIIHQTTKDLTHKSRWETVLIKNKETGQELTKRDIYRYYSQPNIKKNIFEQIKNKPILLRQSMSLNENWLKREPIITKNITNPQDPEDIQYYIERRLTEINPTFGKITDKLIIDVDPKEKITLEETKQVVKFLQKLLENQPYIKDTKIQFSGHRGFYVWGELQTKTDINILRKRLKALLSSIKIINGIKVTTDITTDPKTIRLDLSPLKNLGSVKAEKSLDYRTGYISTEVLPGQLNKFDPKIDATFDPKNLKAVYSLRDEELI